MKGGQTGREKTVHKERKNEKTKLSFGCSAHGRPRLSDISFDINAAEGSQYRDGAS